ncbi:response regulator [Paenibacillus sediminis]|uniref:Two-component system response regulator YesN n=1 Tax=Paenibacillus sediminis TaxID=664909 RepID=A0ABS4H053_9BACL|nr:response regulator [Paenibacillus sediminis]MBP1935841.1 two-component system response regulator YesN [Paenibacillus sediminis]
MYKLILVEDEEHVREGLLEEIDWNQYGFEVVDNAENGKEAVEMIDKLLPDVVVTDIQMPFMNGLQLSEWIRDNYPMTKIIILTGYDEFEYAQKAIRLQIDEYVLKPFSSDEFIHILTKVKRQLDDEVADKENVLTLSEHYRKSLPVLQGVFLSSLVTSKLPAREIHEKSSLYHIDLNGTGFMVSVINIDVVRPEMPNNIAASSTLRETGETQLQMFAVLNIAEEIVHKHSLGKVFIHGDHLIVLTISQDQDQELVSQRTLEVLEEIRQSVEKYLKLTVTIGAGAVCDTIEHINESYNNAIQALDYRLIIGNNKVIWIDDVETRRCDTISFDQLQEQSLIRSLKVGTVQEATEMIDSLFAGLEQLPVSIQDFQIYLLEILTAIIKVAKEMNVELDEMFGTNILPFAEIYKFNNPQEAKQWILTVCTKLMNNIATDRQSSYKKLVEEAIAYMKAHYQDSDISISKVCKHLHISAGYFSNIFKKEAKTTFVNYLMQIRMEAAKDMLRSTDMKTFEIAEQIGFSDPNYFSFCFRKKFGISPKEYRNSARGV